MSYWVLLHCIVSGRPKSLGTLVNRFSTGWQAHRFLFTAVFSSFLEQSRWPFPSFDFFLLPRCCAPKARRLTRRFIFFYFFWWWLLNFSSFFFSPPSPPLSSFFIPRFSSSFVFRVAVRFSLLAGHPSTHTERKNSRERLKKREREDVASFVFPSLSLSLSLFSTDFFPFYGRLSRERGRGGRRFRSETKTRRERKIRFFFTVFIFSFFASTRVRRTGEKTSHAEEISRTTHAHTHTKPSKTTNHFVVGYRPLHLEKYPPNKKRTLPNESTKTAGDPEHAVATAQRLEPDRTRRCSATANRNPIGAETTDRKDLSNRGWRRTGAPHWRAAVAVI